MTKDTITITALRLFLLRGYKNVSLVDVAQEIGITKGGIYHYFSSKEILLNSAIHYLFDRIEVKYQSLFNTEESFYDVLKAIIVERELEVFAQNMLGISGDDYRINFASFALEILHSFPELEARLTSSQLELCKVIQQKLEISFAQGEIRRDVDRKTLAAIILSMLHGQNALGLSLTTKELREQMLDNFWRLIAA